MEQRRFEVRVDGGRRLVGLVGGPEDGDLVLLHGGTPGTLTLTPGEIGSGAERGLRHVTYARPGYQGSDRDPGRNYADSAADSAAVVDALGAGSFYTVGLSGGGGPALACAALLGERVRAAASVAALAPRQGEGLEWLAGAARENQTEFAALEAGEAELIGFIERVAAEMGATRSAAELRDGIAEYLSPADIECLTGEFVEHQLAARHEIAADGIWGWFDDDWAMWKEWGFDLGRIRVPVTIWQGGLDRFVPRQNGKWLAANVSGAKLRFFPEEGHLSLMARHYGAILDDLMASARAG
jgi:pimeloyl-ACP methyl ester carboxylesterase